MTESIPTISQNCLNKVLTTPTSYDTIQYLKENDLWHDSFLSGVGIQEDGTHVTYVYAPRSSPSRLLREIPQSFNGIPIIIKEKLSIPQMLKVMNPAWNGRF